MQRGQLLVRQARGGSKIWSSGVWTNVFLRWSIQVGVQGHPPLKKFEIQVLGKVISSVFKVTMPLIQPLFFSYFKHELLLKIYKNRDRHQKILLINLKYLKPGKDSPPSMLFFSLFHNSVFSKDIINIYHNSVCWLQCISRFSVRNRLFLNVLISVQGV